MKPSQTTPIPRGRIKPLLVTIFALSSFSVNGQVDLLSSSGSLVAGDTFQIDWRYPDLTTTIASTISVTPIVWNAGSGVTVNLTDGQIVVTNDRLGWTGSEYIPFNGFVFTDLTRNPNFTSFTLVSITGAFPPPWSPELNFDADQLRVNFAPGGRMNLGYVDGSTYTFAFTTEVPEPSSLGLYTSVLAMLMFWKHRPTLGRRDGKPVA